MGTELATCQGCGLVDAKTVRKCCIWEGNTTLCGVCRMRPDAKFHTPGHVCGRGIEIPIVKGNDE